MLVVFPVPGGPLRMMFGMFPLATTARSFEIVSSLPTTSDLRAGGSHAAARRGGARAPGARRTCGRYFSTHGASAEGAML